jgi:uncharacterized membrane protein YdjX (TVP38/TMEM64 family)
MVPAMRRIRRFLPLLLLIAAIAAVWWSGWLDQLSWSGLARNHAALAGWVAGHPVGAPGLFVLLYIAVAALSVPEAAIVTLAGGLLFGTVGGGILTVIGATIGACILFIVARSALAEPLARRGGAVMRTVRDRLHRDGFLYLLSIRLIPAFPFWLVNLAAALCGMRVLPFAAATFVGIAPGTFVFASIGSGIGNVLATGGRPDLGIIFSLPVLGPLIALAALSLLPLLWRKRIGAGG